MLSRDQLELIRQIVLDALTSLDEWPLPAADPTEAALSEILRRLDDQLREMT
jgi:hypothetical protein